MGSARYPHIDSFGLCSYGCSGAHPEHGHIDSFGVRSYYILIELIAPLLGQHVSAGN